MQRLLGLDALRGIAALAVAIMHLSSIYDLGWQIGSASFAVDFFFMLSGYVMARTYEQRMIEGLSTRGFLRIRYRRVWPTMAVGTIIGGLSYLAIGPIPTAGWVMFVLNLFLLPALPLLFLYNGPAWSVFFELVANALHPRILARISARWLLVSAFLMIPALALATEALGYFPRGTKTAAFAATFLRLLIPYCIGIAMYRLCRDRAPILIPLWLSLLALPCFVALVAAFQPPLAFMWFDLIVAPLMMFGGLAATHRYTDEVFTYLGNLSFPLYAIHLPIFQLSAWSLGLSAPVAFVFAIGLASLGAADWKPFLMRIKPLAARSKV